MYVAHSMAIFRAASSILEGKWRKTPMAATGPEFKPGAIVPGTKYSIVRQIGAGGMGIVYQVVKPPSIQGVLKLMSRELTSHEEFRVRFLDEVRILAQLDHPNIVKVFDYDKLPDGTPFYVMELLHGQTLRDVLATVGRIPPRVAFEVSRQLCEAMHGAHTHDIPVVHRDIKPENIFLHAPRHGEPQVKLIDFGVVSVADRQHDGAFVGTWKYAAPEQIRGERPTPATDIYAAGLVLYEMLCGVSPFGHLETGPLVSEAHLRELPAPVSKFAPWVPPSIVQLIAAALAKEPRHRPRDARAFAEHLYDLEWADDGNDPRGPSVEGALSRILSTAGGPEKPESKNLVAIPPKDRISQMPVLGIPHEARHSGATAPGLGRFGPPSEEGATEEGCLVRRADAITRAKEPIAKQADTFGAHESDAHRLPRPSKKRAWSVALALVSTMGAVSLAAHRATPRPSVAQKISTAPPVSKEARVPNDGPTLSAARATTSEPPARATQVPSASAVRPVAKSPTATPFARTPAAASTHVERTKKKPPPSGPIDESFLREL